jgi:hypothetical protein
MDLPKLAKAIITNTQTGEQIPVMFNPEEYTLEQGNTFAEIGIPGLDAPPTQYVRGKLRTLAMELLFDTYELGIDVRLHTGRIVRLLEQDPRTFAPPVLLFAMGQLAFQCVLVDASQRFTMFRRDGTPVRATLTVRFQEYTRIEIEITQGFFAGPPTLHTITSGETISSIATSYLGNPGDWRAIAEANGIDDPLNLPVGLPLQIPSPSAKRGPS